VLVADQAQRGAHRVEAGVEAVAIGLGELRGLVLAGGALLHQLAAV
jgi:hypothetical protein